MAGPFVVDASVFLNAFISIEAGHSTSRELLARLQANAVPIVVPTLLLPETAAAISRGQKDPELARRFAAALRRLPHLVWVSLDDQLARQAVDIAAHFRLRGSDAVYGAVAGRFACALVTLDCEQHDHMAEALTTYFPSELLEII